MVIPTIKTVTVAGTRPHLAQFLLVWRSASIGLLHVSKDNGARRDPIRMGTTSTPFDPLDEFDATVPSFG